MKRIFFCLAWLLTQVWLPANAEVPAQLSISKQLDWYVLLLDGAKVGYQRSERLQSQSEVTSRELMEMQITRGAASIKQSIEVITVEDLNGKPLSFQTIENSSGSEAKIYGIRTDSEHFSITETRAGRTSTRVIKLPSDVRFMAAIDRELSAQKLALGQEVTHQAFDSAVMEVINLRTKLVGYKHSDLPPGVTQLLQLEQVVQMAQASMTVRSLVNSDFRPYQVTTEIGGVKLVQNLASEAEAKAPNHVGGEFFDNLMIKAPTALSASALKQGLRIELKYSGPEPVQFPNSDEQKVTQDGKRVTLEICQRCGQSAASELAPTVIAEAKLPNSWLQSDDQALQQLARKTTLGSKTNLEKMRKLEALVRRHISNKDLSVGYASAKETLVNKSGDCTEHALLLAALGRAVNIPTRVATGFAYADAFLGQDLVFVPHAWTQAYLNGRWQSFDAALTGFDAGHILTGFGDGNPYSYFSAQHLLGNLEILKITPLAKEAQ